MQKIKNLALINTATGTCDSEIFLKKIPSRLNGRWFRIFFKNLERLSDSKLHGETYRVLIKVLSQVKYGNNLPTQSAIAKQLGMKQSGIARAFKELKNENIIVKSGATFYINPEFAWYGADEDWAYKVKDLLPEWSLKLSTKENN